MGAAAKAVGDALRELVVATERAREEVSSASTAADGVVMNVRMVSAMIGQLLHGIDEVWTSGSAPAKAADEALASVRATSHHIAELGELGRQIGNIVAVIDGITKTTNVLALNATIEAAHAGEFGKGFAVVASEVKILSRRTSEATVEIARKIERMQATTEGASRSMGDTERSVQRIHEMVGQVTEAVAAQKELTSTVQTYMTEAAESASAIADTVGKCDAAIGDAVRVAREVLAGAMPPGDASPDHGEGNTTCPSWNGIPS